MSRATLGGLFKPTLLLAALALSGGAAQAQQMNTVEGRVTDHADGRPVVGARVTVVGTALMAATNADGRFWIRGVKAGQVTLRAAYIGYSSMNKTVTVTDGGTTTVDFALVQTPFSLDEFVVTATGDQAKREVGNAVARIDAAKVAETVPVANVGDILVAKAPGVQVLPGNLTGAGQRIRIRGTNSLSLGNEPIFVIDGVRMTSDNNSSSIGIGGTNPSRLNDINPDDIESIEVVRGPSAATLYGTDAANGVIVIKTKRGAPGKTRWNVWVEQAVSRDQNDWPDAYRAYTRNAPSSNPANRVSTATNLVQCVLADAARGLCTQDSVTKYNLFKDREATPLGTGHRQQYGVNASGGTDAVRFFVSGEWEDEQGLLKMPEFAQALLKTQRSVNEVPPEQLRPNALRRVSVRANVNANLTDRIDLAVSTGFVTSNQRLPQTDNNLTGLLSNALGGLNRDNGRLGYRAYTPNESFADEVSQGINRTILSATANWRPTAWLTVRGTGGLDYTARKDTELCRRDQCVNFSTYRSGFKEDNRTNFFQYTADFSATGSFQLTRDITSQTAAGAQYFKSLFERNGAYGENLPPGATTVTAGATLLADETTSETITTGAYVQQQFGLKNRLFVTGALRFDRNSAQGKNLGTQILPKGSVSYVISEEPFFPKARFLNSVRLRGAFGEATVQPGTTDAVRYFTPQVANVDGADVSSLVFSALGNPDLKPERTREIELGMDAGLFNNRVTLELTFYDKKSRDALISRTVPPSVGASVSRFENIGAVRNRGFEWLVNARIVESRALGVDIGFNGSHNSNEILDLGGVPPIVDATRQQRVGYPIDGFWQRPILGYNDADGNGMLDVTEITVGDTAVFVGYDRPRTEITTIAGIDLLNRKLRIQGLFDYKGGYYVLNGTDRIRCQSRINCREVLDPTTPLERQARGVAVLRHPSATQYGFMEKGDFIRFRELSVTYELPSSLARAMRAARVSITGSARNLGLLWTDYTGLDPEANYFGGARGTSSNFQTQPPPTYYSFRLNVGF